MKNIYIVRHGQSEENATKILADGGSPLTAEGIREAGIIASRVAQLKAEVIICSDYVRAKQTADIISQQVGVSVEVLPYIYENKYPGRIIGHKQDEPEILQIALNVHAGYADPDFHYEDAESFNDLKKRARTLLDHITKHPAENMLIVSHALFIKMMVGEMLFGDALTGEVFKSMIHGLRLKNTGITWCEYSDKFFQNQWKINTWNDHNHLAEV